MGDCADGVGAAGVGVVLGGFYGGRGDGGAGSAGRIVGRAGFGEGGGGTGAQGVRQGVGVLSEGLGLFGVGCYDVEAVGEAVEEGGLQVGGYQLGEEGETFGFVGGKGCGDEGVVLGVCVGVIKGYCGGGRFDFDGGAVNDVENRL